MSIGSKERDVTNRTGATARARFFWGSRNPVSSQGSFALATPEPSWNHRGTKQVPCGFMRFRRACCVGTIVERSRNHVALATSEPLWNYRGTKQETCEFIRFRHTCD
eukprot:1614991-Pyramimonas_sp.AAC.2